MTAPMSEVREGAALTLAECRELEAERMRRATATDALPIRSTLAEYDAARVALVALSDADLWQTIHAEHAARGAFGAPSATYVAAVDIERERRRARGAEVHRFHTGAPRDDTDAGGPAGRRPVVEVWSSPWSPWCTDADDAELRRQTELGAARRNPERYAVWVHTGGDQYDGGAVMAATHYIDADGIEREYPTFMTPHKRKAWRGALVRVGVVAQPGEVRATARKSVRWHGRSANDYRGPAASIRPEHRAAAHDAATIDGGALADTGHRAREHGRALVGDDGCNALVNGRRVRLRPLTAEGALWLHLCADTGHGAQYAEGDPQRVVGAIEDAPRRRHGRPAVVVQWVHQTDTDGNGNALVREVVRHTIDTDRNGWRNRSVTTDGRTYAGNLNAELLQEWTPLAHTARSATIRADRRRGLVDRPERTTTEYRRTDADRKREQRRRSALVAARTALMSGALPAGRSHSAPVQAAAVALVVALVTGADPVALVDTE